MVTERHRIDGFEFIFTEEGVVVTDARWLDDDSYLKALRRAIDACSYLKVVRRLEGTFHVMFGKRTVPPEWASEMYEIIDQSDTPTEDLKQIIEWAHVWDASHARVKRILHLDSGFDMANFLNAVDWVLEGREKAEADRLRTEQEKAQTHGYVYILKSPTNHYKIGKALEPHKRQGRLATQLPFPVERIHTIECENYHKAERELQDKFASKWVNGEWYALSEDDINWLRGIQKM